MRTVGHALKLRSEFFDAVASGDKRVEVRRNDRGFEVGDHLRLREWFSALPRGIDPSSNWGSYSGRFINVEVTHVLRESECVGLYSGYVALSIVVHEIGGKS